MLQSGTTFVPATSTDEALKTVRGAHQLLASVSIAVLLFSVPALFRSHESRRILSTYVDWLGALDSLVRDRVSQRQEALSQAFVKRTESLKGLDAKQVEMSDLACIASPGIPRHMPLEQHPGAITTLALQEIDLDYVEQTLALFSERVSDTNITFHISELTCRTSESPQSWRLRMVPPAVPNNMRTTLTSRLELVQQRVQCDIVEPFAIYMRSPERRPALISVPLSSSDVRTGLDLLRELRVAHDEDWERVRSLTPDEGLRTLEALEKNPPLELRALGIAVDVELASILGPSCILVTAVVLLLHLIRLRPLPNEARSFPWLGLYGGRIATPLAYGSVGALPLASSILFWVAVGPPAKSWPWRFAVGVTAIMVIVSVRLAVELARLRRRGP
jgi:hypothetical protein